MTQKDFEELEAKYNKMIRLKERQSEAYKFCSFIRARTTPSEDPAKERKRIACREMFINYPTTYGVDDIDIELADELLPVIERFCEKLEKEFEEE